MSDLDMTNEAGSVYPPDDIPVAAIPAILRGMRGMLSNLSAVNAQFFEDVVDGDFVYFSPLEGLWYPALGSTEVLGPASSQRSIFDNANKPLLGVASLKHRRVFFDRLITTSKWAFTPGAVQYLSMTHAGKLTETANNSPVGIAIAPHTLFVFTFGSSIERELKILRDIVNGLQAGGGQVVLSDRIDLDSSTTAASSKAVKTLADLMASNSTTDVMYIDAFTTDGISTDYMVGDDIVLDPNAANLFLVLGGMAQEPVADYTIVGRNIIRFSEAPHANLRCWGLSSLNYANPDIRAAIDRAILKVNDEADFIINQAKAWAESSLPPDPKDPFSKSAKSWAAEAAEIISDVVITVPGTNTPRSIAERFADVVNVKDFGAVGDGVTDDTSAFKEAAATGKNVFIPGGKYVVSERIVGSFFSVDTVNILGKGSVVVHSWKRLADQLEAATGGRRTLRYNKDGVPSVFYRLPMYYLDDIISTWPHEPHPAFVVNDPTTGNEIILREILIGCYEASLVDDKYAVSQPGKLPHTYQPFDIALAYCRANNVPGGISVEYEREHPNEYVITANGELDEKSYFHMMTNAEYSAIALWCWKHGNEPRGNSWYGQNGFHPEERGAYPTKRYNYDMGQLEDPYLGMPGNTQKYVIDGDPSSGINPQWGNCPTMTGSSPLAWMHDGSSCGIENIVGNVATMVAGLRVYDGQLQTFANNNAALPDADLCGRVPLSPGNTLDTGDYDRQTYYSEDWKGYKAFNLSGELVHPSTANTLKIDGSYMRDGRKTPVYEDGKLVRTYGCGKMAFATKIDVPDSGGTDQTKYSYDEDTGTFYLDPVNGVGNGSASNSFQTLQLDPDNPADTSNPVRAEDGQPGYLMRALGLYPICAHADLYPSVSQAQAADRDQTNPITGIMSPVKHEGYYYDNGYLTDEIKAAYGSQRGRVYSRVPGDRAAQRGGVYYYEDPTKFSDPDDPNCSLWTTSYANRRYETARNNVPGAINVSDIGVGWMNGYRLCVIEFEGGD